MQYKDYKAAIAGHLDSAAEDYFAIGYCLRKISEGALFTEDGYKNIWDFAKGEYGLSNSSASRFMAINERFSNDGGITMKPEYEGLGVSKLQEMLSLPDSTLEQVTKETTVKELRALKESIRDEAEGEAEFCDVATEEKDEKAEQTPPENGAGAPETSAKPQKTEREENMAVLKEVRALYDHLNYIIPDAKITADILKHLFRNSGGNYSDKVLKRYDGTARGISINGRRVLSWSTLAGVFNSFKSEDAIEAAKAAEAAAKEEAPEVIDADFTEVSEEAPEKPQEPACEPLDAEAGEIPEEVQESECEAPERAQRAKDDSPEHYTKRDVFDALMKAQRELEAAREAFSECDDPGTTWIRDKWITYDAMIALYSQVNREGEE